LPADGAQRYTQWAFGDWPDIMEIRQGGQTLLGFPALIDGRDAVTVEVFDEPEVAARKHHAGLRRLFALQLRDALKYLEKNIPDLQQMAVAYMALGTLEELREQIIAVAMNRAFMREPLPASAADFKLRLDEGRSRLTLICHEVARLCATVLIEYSAVQRKLKDTKGAPEAVADASQQLQRLMGQRFLLETPWACLQHVPRYLKAIVMRLDKCRTDPARDAARMADAKQQEQRYWRLVAERKGVTDERMNELRWLLEEWRVSLFAQELRTPQPVSLKRLDKVWAQLAQ
jgi:ATP-dependent helicase HrpA